MAKTSVSPIASMIRRLAEDHQSKTLSDQELLRRFSAGQDEVAFGSLLRRHGSMVLNVCRNVAGSEEDAEDAFQATFIVLARKAKSIKRLASAASWLHGVAYRTALHGRKTSATRQKHEHRAGRARGGEFADDLSWREAQHLIHAELTALPESYRAPLVLCFLEGRTQDEAAKQLNIAKSTLKKRLEHGRALLRMRLLRRGLGPAAILAACSWPAATVSACLPRVLATATVKAATAYAAGHTTAGLISGQVTVLVASAIKATLATKLKVATTVLLALALVPTLGGRAFQDRPAGDVAIKSAFSEPAPKPAALKAALRSPAAEAKTPTPDKDLIVYGGRVLGSNGKPVAGAGLYMTRGYSYAHRPIPSPKYATTGPDGRFRFTVPKEEFIEDYTVVAAMAANHGAGWVGVPHDGKRDNLTLQLVDDPVPITGKLIDLEGKPIPGATVRVLQISAAPGDDLGPWLEAVKTKKALALDLEQKYLPNGTIALSPTVTTDLNGRFRLTGMGGDRLVRVQIDAPTITSQQFCILSRLGKAFEVIHREGRPDYGESSRVLTYHGADSQYVAAPSRPIKGMVRDKDTKKPLAGVVIESLKFSNDPIWGMNIVHTTTDAQGRYLLTGMPKGEGNEIRLLPGNDRPYVSARAPVPDSPGVDPVQVDFELKRGIWIEGKITDKVTGKPVRAQVEYHSFYTNPNLNDYRGFIASGFNAVRVKEDGSYRTIGLPGPGLMAVYHMPDYLLVSDRDDEFGVKESSLNTAPFAMTIMGNYSAVARMEPATGLESFKCDISLDPGWKVTGTVLGPDGKVMPVEGPGAVTGWGWGKGKDLKKDEFTVWPFNPRRPHDIIFRHPKLGLVAKAQLPKENGTPITVRMEPGSTVTGRLIGANGQPRPSVKLAMAVRLEGGRDGDRLYLEAIETDRDGRFRINALLPGYYYRLTDDTRKFNFGTTLRLGHTTDLGDVRIPGKKE